MQKQLDFISLIDKATNSRRGRKATVKSKIICKGNPGSRKKIRPFRRKEALHVTLRSSQAKGAWSFLKHDNYFAIMELLESLKRRFHITIEKQSINGNHLHLLLRAQTKENLSGFLRALSGLIVRKITGSERGAKLESEQRHRSKTNRPEKFWDHRPFSRIVTLGRDFANVVKYIAMNINESIGDRSLGRYFGKRTEIRL